MPRTRSQAVESPLVSLDTPRRRKRPTAAPKPPADTKDATTAKPKRGRKVTKKEAVTEKAPEEKPQIKSILRTSDHIEDRKAYARQADKEREAKIKQQAEEQQKKTVGSPSKRKGKKRARDSHDEENHDEAPSAQRRRLTNAASETPLQRRTTTPRRRLTYAEIRRRANERQQENAPSMFRLDLVVAQHEEQEKAAKIAAEAAEERRLQAISRTAMERHAIVGPMPENLQNSFEVPIFDPSHHDSAMPLGAAETSGASQAPPVREAPETPTSNNAWGFDIRNFFTSVRGSVRRLVPTFRPGTEQAVPFVSGGDATPLSAAANGTASRPAETSGNGDTQMDLTYSLFPPSVESPQNSAPAKFGASDAVEHVSGETKLTTAHVPEKSTDKSDMQSTKDPVIAANRGNGSSAALSLEQIVSTSEPKDANQDPEPENASKKRKRPPTPDSIPNPPGVSYGLHDDWFTYSEEEIAEAEAYCAAKAEREAAEAAEAAAKSAPTVAAPIAERPEKRARFLPSETSTSQSPETPKASTGSSYPEPYIPPGWARPTTTVYNGTLFQEANGQPPLRPRGSLLSKHGDVNRQPPANSTLPFEPASQQQGAATNGSISHPSKERSDVNGVVPPPPTTPSPPNVVNDDPISLPPIIQPISAASKGPLADIHKPNNPSRLRNAVRLSSSPVSQQSPVSQPSSVSNSREPNQQDLMEEFGDDEYGRQAYDIYRACPSGDLSQMQWPAFEPLPSDGAQQSINATQSFTNYPGVDNATFHSSFEQFQNQFDQGLIDSDAILNDLPL